MGAAGNVDAIGFPAIDYLLFAGGEATVLERFSTDVNSENAKVYLKEVIAKMKTEFGAVTDAWTNGYRDKFVANTGTDVGSSISILFNEILQDLELLKNAKIGIPAGQFSGGMPLPDYVEAYYSGYSKDLAVESCASLERLFTGGSKLGYDDYMEFVGKTQDLPVTVEEILAQFDKCRFAIQALNDPFSEDVPTNFEGFNTAFQELKRLVAYCKVDVTAALGVLVTYSDTDGD